MGPNTEADLRSPSDEMDLVARIIAGDSGLFHQLVRPYERDAYLIAFSMFLHPARAEEVVQEAFICAYRDLENFHGDSRFSNWLFRLLVDHATSRKQPEKTICPLSDAGMDGA
jgi:RNA polymerase sigma-70 factor, ECF subfamily